MRISLFLTGLVVVSLLAINVFAENGVTNDQIVLGQSCALTGPAEALGTGMAAGLNACFEEANAAGGINGRKIKLITKDDGYEPNRAIENVRQLIDKDHVFALIGEVGTPTSKAVVPIAEEAGVPFFGPFTGAEFLRNPYRKFVVNVRGSYFQEMEKLVEYLVDKQGLKNIACFYQNDGYGQAGLEGLEKALTKRSMKLVAMGTYERNTLAVKGAVLKIRKAKPDAIVMVGAYKPCAEFIKLAKKTGMKDTTYCNISFVGTEALRDALGKDGEGCIISQVVHFPWDKSVSLVDQYQNAMKTYQPKAKLGFVSLEGYMVGKLFCKAMEKVTGDPSRDGLIAALDNTGAFDLGGVTLEFGPDDHQGMDEVFLTIIKEDAITPL
ncbi:MAG: ABC transporter substrate-binding protein [Pirellulales bacterium]|nr:ABC transporter substrate-binding protein [Pirellulales bacterium]